MDSDKKWITASGHDINVNAMDQAWYPRKFTAFQRTFFEVAILRNNMIYQWIFVLALPDEAKHFWFQVFVKNDMGETVRTYFEQVQSMVEGFDTVNYWTLSVKKAKTFAGNNTNQLKYSLKIRNLKDEAKDEDEESGIDD